MVDEAKQVVAFNYDWDDNVMHTASRIYLLNHKTQEYVPVSTGDFAQIHQQLGQPGEWENFSVSGHSFSEFRDHDDDHNIFHHAVQAAVKNDHDDWQAHSWQSFVKAHQGQVNEGAEVVTSLVTARGHSPDNIHQSLTYLQQQGWIDRVPEVHDIYPVDHDELIQRYGEASSIPDRKAQVLIELVDKVQAKTLPEEAVKVLTPDADEHRGMHLCGFSDDDRKNFEQARDVLSEQVKQGRWPDVKLTLIYTGEGEREAVVIRSDGSTRPYQEQEYREVPDILGDDFQHRSIKAKSHEQTVEGKLRATMMEQGYQPEAIEKTVQELSQRLQQEHAAQESSLTRS